MDDSVKALFKELGEAINETVTGSPRVESIMQAIRESGFEAYLMLEVNIAVQDKRLSGEEIFRAEVSPDEWFTEDDRRFLKRLRIAS
ncbi:MAG TPA: hypothetical protein VF747_17540 [Blastocatellia bacterium]|jgi:hypothetical protein